MKPLYHDSPLMDVQVVEGQGKMEVRKLQMREKKEGDMRCCGGYIQ